MHPNLMKVNKICDPKLPLESNEGGVGIISTSMIATPSNYLFKVAIETLEKGEKYVQS